MSVTSGNDMSHLAALSAGFGSLASVLGKYAFDTDKTSLVAQHACNLLRTMHLTTLATLITPSSSLLPPALSTLPCPSLLLWPLRAVLFASLLLCNSGMLTLLVRSMNSVGTLHATTVSSAAAFVLSGCVGWLLFDERLNAQWLLGVAVILAGVYTMLLGQRQAESRYDTKAASAAAR